MARLWDINTGQCLRILDGHSQSIEDVYFSKNALFSNSWDGMTIEWEYANGNFERKKIKKSNMRIKGNYVIFRNDKLKFCEIKSITNGKTFKTTTTKSYDNASYCQTLNEKYVITSDNESYPSSFILWDLITGQKIRHLNLNSNVRSVRIQNNLLVTASEREVLIYDFSY